MSFLNPDEITQLVNPVGMSTRALTFVYRAAKAMPERQRGAFLKRLFAHLAKNPTDEAVMAMCNAIMNTTSHQQHTKNKNRDDWDRLFKH